MSAGVKKGDRVSIYMPMVVELVVAMLACVRIGAVHSIVVSWRHELVKYGRLEVRAHVETVFPVCRVFC